MTRPGKASGDPSSPAIEAAFLLLRVPRFCACVRARASERERVCVCVCVCVCVLPVRVCLVENRKFK